MFQSWSSSSRVASCVSAENGSLPRSMKYKMTPAAKTSTFGQSQVRWNSKIQWKPPWSTMVLPSIFPMKTATRYHRKTKFGPMVSPILRPTQAAAYCGDCGLNGESTHQSRYQKHQPNSSHGPGKRSEHIQNYSKLFKSWPNLQSYFFLRTWVSFEQATFSL